MYIKGLAIILIWSSAVESSESFKVLYCGPQGQYKNIYPSSKIYIPVQKYVSQYKHFYPSTKRFSQYKFFVSQYKNIFSVQKHFSSPKNIYPSIKIFLSLQKCLSSEIFPYCIASLVRFPPKQDGRFRGSGIFLQDHRLPKLKIRLCICFCT